MISPNAVDTGRVVFVIFACIVSWGFGLMCGAAAMIGFEESRQVRDNRPTVDLPKHMPVGNFTIRQGQRAPLVPVDGQRQ